MAVEQLGLRKLSVFYREVRELTVTLEEGLETERDVLEGIYTNLALAASSLAAQFAGNALSLFGEEDRMGVEEGEEALVRCQRGRDPGQAGRPSLVGPQPPAQ